MPIFKLFAEGVSILQSSPFESVRVLQQGIFKHILMKYFRQDSEIVSFDLHTNGIFPVGCQVTPTLKKSKYVWKLTRYADFQVLVCRYWILGVQIWLFQNTTYSNKILVKRLSIQIWISGAFYLPLTTTTCVMLHASGCSGVRLPCRSPSPLSSWTFSTSLMIFISSQFEKSWF